MVCTLSDAISTARSKCPGCACLCFTHTASDNGICSRCPSGSASAALMACATRPSCRTLIQCVSCRAGALQLGKAALSAAWGPQHRADGLRGHVSMNVCDFAAAHAAGTEGVSQSLCQRHKLQRGLKVLLAAPDGTEQLQGTVAGTASSLQYIRITHCSGAFIPEPGHSIWGTWLPRPNPT